MSRRMIGHFGRLGELAELGVGSGLSRSGTDLTVQIDSARNALINGDFRVWQRGTTFTSATTPANNDDTYLADRWILLTDESGGADVVDVSQETTTIPTGSRGAIKLDVERANKKFGILQILENKDSLPFAGSTCSLSFKARVTGTSITRINGMVVEWTSTADSVTSDIVNTWGADETNPTLVANWAFSDTPATPQTALTTAYQTYSFPGITVGATAANIGVFIWMDSIDGANPTVGDFLFISDVQLEKGSFATSFAPRPFAQELQLARRFYCKSFPLATAPAENGGVAGSVTTIGGANGSFVLPIRFDVDMFATPTVTTYNPSAANSSARNVDDSTDTTVQIVTGSGSTSGTSIEDSTGGTGGDASNVIAIHYKAEAEL